MLPLLLFAAASADSAVIEEVVVTALKRENSRNRIQQETVIVTGLSILLIWQEFCGAVHEAFEAHGHNPAS
jgi:hypothetical protein